MITPSDNALRRYVVEENHEIPPDVVATIAPLLLKLLGRYQKEVEDELLIAELFLPLDGGAGHIRAKAFFDGNEEGQSNSSAN